MALPTKAAVVIAKTAAASEAVAAVTTAKTVADSEAAVAASAVGEAADSAVVVEAVAASAVGEAVVAADSEAVAAEAASAVVVEAVADSGADAAVAEVVDSEDAIDRIHPHLLLSFPLLLSLLHPSSMYNAPSSIVPPRPPASPPGRLRHAMCAHWPPV